MAKRNETPQFIERQGETFLHNVETRQAEIMLDAERLREILAKLEIDPLQINCTKTGQPIGHRNWGQFYAHVSVAYAHHCENAENAQDELNFILGLLQENACAAHWLQTDGSHLDHLQIIDPVGYFVYAASHIVAHHYKAGAVRREHAREANTKLFKQKCNAHAMIADLLGIENTGAFLQGKTDTVSDETLNELHKANSYLQRILCVDPAVLHFPYRTIEEIVLAAFVSDTLFDTLSATYNAWLENKINYKGNYLQIANNKGPAQFRTQVSMASRGAEETDELLAVLNEFNVFLKFKDTNDVNVARSFTGARESKAKAVIREQNKRAAQSGVEAKPVTLPGIFKALGVSSA